MADLDKWLEQLYEGRILAEREIRLLCEMAKEILVDEPNVKKISGPVHVIGDLHGQFHDLLNFFDKVGRIPSKKYILLGDYVDRGYNSCETWQLLLCLKVRFPDHITLLRGNHETRQINAVYGFYDECKRKYGNENVWANCMEVMDLLGIVALVNENIMCVHGGISPELNTLGQIRLINRDSEPPFEGGFCDLLWSDPTDMNETWAVSNRGAGWLFGSQVTA
jgi:serine/threonine-protein phosphatase 6 catalytic subunit